MDSLHEIYNNLNKGYLYAIPIIWQEKDIDGKTILKKSLGWTLKADKKYIFWTYYGSSAEKKNLKNLKWTLENIFKMSPLEFLKKFTLFTEETENIFYNI